MKVLLINPFIVKKTRYVAFVWHSILFVAAVERSENFSVRRALSDDIQYRTKATTFVL